MYLRATPRKNKDGSVVRYLQLAHNVWDPVAKRSRAEIVYSFGREEAVSRAALERLVSSVSRFLAPEAALGAVLEEGSPSSSLVPWAAPTCSTPSGAVWVSTRPCAGSCADDVWTPAPSGCSSPSSRTGRSPPPPSSRPPAG